MKSLMDFPFTKHCSNTDLQFYKGRERNPAGIVLLHLDFKTRYGVKAFKNHG